MNWHGCIGSRSVRNCDNWLLKQLFVQQVYGFFELPVIVTVCKKASANIKRVKRL